MQYSRRDLVDELLDFMGEGQDSGAEDTAIALVSRVYFTLWLKKPWRDHRMPSPYTFTTVADTRSYAMPAYFGRVAGVKAEIRNVTNGSRIRLVDQDVLEDEHPEAGTTLEQSSQPCFYHANGSQPVQTQPASTGDALEVVSDNVTDGTTVRVSVEGLDANGVYQTFSGATNGTTAVSTGTWSLITSWSKTFKDANTDWPQNPPGSSSIGTLSLRKVSGAVVLDSLRAWESSHTHRVLTLYPKPDAAYLISVPVLRAPVRLEAESDALPFAWGPAIMEEARLEWSMNQGDLDITTFASVPRPRFKELVEYDNELLYKSMRSEPYS